MGSDTVATHPIQSARVGQIPLRHLITETTPPAFPRFTSSPRVAATRAECHGRNGIFSFYVKRVQREMRRENNLNNGAESKAEGCFTRSVGECV